MKMKTIPYIVITISVLISLQSCIDRERNNTDKTFNRTINNHAETEAHSDATAEKLIDQITGKWRLQDVRSQGTSITTSSPKNQSLHFTREKRYERYANNEKIDSGGFSVNERHNAIYLRSENNNAATEWNASLNDNDELILSKKDGSEHSENYEFVYVRKN
jgi:hypothetical protein